MTLSVPPKGDADLRLGAHFAPLEVKAQDAPNMTVKVRAGSFWDVVGVHFEFVGGNSPTITVPGSLAKWVIVAVNTTGIIQLFDGTPSNSPLQPTLPKNVVPLAAIFVNSTATAVTNDMIFDVRPQWRANAEVVPNLTAEIANRPTFTDINALLDGKCDVDGTPNTIFFLNKDQVGIAQTDVELVVERGAEPNVSIKWNELLNQWEFTNDGTTFIAIGGLSALAYYTKSELDNGALDPRYFTESEVTSLFSPIVHTHTSSQITDIANFSMVGHTHVTADITNFNVSFDTRLGTKSVGVLSDVELIGAVMNKHVLVYNFANSRFENRFLVEADISNLQNYALVGHTHIKANITDFVETDYVHTTGIETIAGNKTFTGNVTINGTLTAVTSVNTEITDNEITLNAGEVGAGVGEGASGLIIDRGTLTDARLYFDETIDKWLIHNGTGTFDIALIDGTFVLRTGDTMTGLLTLSGAPTLPLHAATKAYVDSVGGGLATHIADMTVHLTPAQNTFVDNVEAASTGIVVKSTVGNNAVTRAITVTAGHLTVTDGNGVAANPLLGLPAVGVPVVASFVKITTDVQGRVSTTTPVVVGDITALVSSTYVDVAGDTMTGLLTLSGAPTLPLHAATKAYVDGVFATVPTTLNDLTDVTIAGPVIADILRYNGAQWVNVALTKSLITNFVEADYVHMTGIEIIAGAKTFSAATTFSSNVVVGGDLTVSGTTTTVNSNTVFIGDNILTLNSDEAGIPSQNAGIEIERGTSTNASMLWDETNDRWMAGLLAAELIVSRVGDMNYQLQVGTGGAAYTTAFLFITPTAGKASLMVFVNGLKQVEGALKAYTITAPNTVTFNAPFPLAGDDVEFYGV